jgi:D-cysteine desulfhydrase
VALTDPPAPRVALGTFPTPLTRDQRLGELLGLDEVWVKRDDLSGFSWGGNKVRAVEFLLGDIVASGADVVVVCGGPSSNFAALMAAAAATLELAVVQVSYGDEPPVAPAALVAARDAGAEVGFTGSEDRTSMEIVAREMAGTLRSGGARPAVVPRGGATAVGALGFAEAAAELADQMGDAGLEAATVVLPVGSGGSMAGLLAGQAALLRLGGSTTGGVGFSVLGVSVSRPPDEVTASVATTASACADLLGFDGPVASPWLVDGRGSGFGADEASAAFAASVERRTGLLIDAVYNAKALAWLAAHPSITDAVPSRPVVYWHTGGALGTVDLIVRRRDRRAPPEGDA